MLSRPGGAQNKEGVGCGTPWPLPGESTRSKAVMPSSCQRAVGAELAACTASAGRGTWPLGGRGTDVCIWVVGCPWERRPF